VAKQFSRRGSKKPSPPKKNSAGKKSSLKSVASPRKATRRIGIKGVDISPDERVNLYAVARRLPSSFQDKSGLRLPFVTYFQDPFVAKQDPDQAFDEEVFVNWEPGLADGPTSSRFAVVDYNSDTGKLAAPAEWDEPLQKFVSNGKALDKTSASLFQFHQVSLWALLQRALAFFEDSNGLGRTIPWAFEGNRLIVVPHAGYGENAYSDRRSKSLQFYYFGTDKDTVYTCLSSDIVSHEFAHAVLDGTRPFFNESGSVQTAAFHEFTGDFAAILLTLRNNTLRGRLAVATAGKIEKATTLASIAEEFGMAVSGRPYLRTALNQDKMTDLADETSPHRLSQVLTGAMFDVLMRVADSYQTNLDDQQESDTDAAPGTGSKATPKQAFYRAAERMQRMAIQPLDLLPPVEVTFRDYALAACRAQKLSDPIDPHAYYDILIDVFRKREIFSAEDELQLKQPQYLQDRLRLSVPHSIDDISRSRAAAYRFLDDNREDLLIPANRDFFIADLYDARKRARQGLPLPRQIIVEYVWREEVPLNGPQFGKFDGRTTTMLCGGTLVFDDYGNVLYWARKPGSLPYGGKRNRGGAVEREWKSAVNEGTARRNALLENLAAQVAAGRIGNVVGTEKGILASRMPPMTAEDDDEFVRFQLSPHLNLSQDSQELEAEETGARQWQISC
jgi:hypothetical protein